MLGKWESSTRGVASRIMRNMGYVHGAGLGPEGEGIMNPIMAKWKRDKTGVGVEPDQGLEEMDDDEADATGTKRKRGGRKKQVLARGMKDKDDAKKADPKGVVHVLSSMLMKGYGKAMLRKAEDGSTAKELTGSMLHAREAHNLANKQLQSLEAALERNKNNQSTRSEIESKMKLVKQHASELKRDQDRIQGKQDRLSGKKVQGKNFF
ncbi:hypothetical protein T484DRAFT_1973178 [Baffinella frigidus]|nr:hypothetical protein T484DRAFT_1973178 [Cryptophyta sp. CCMP2293]